VEQHLMMHITPLTLLTIAETIRLRRRWISENSKANRIETMKGRAESGEICSVEVEEK
jgi:hypothetical protein